MVHCVLNMGVPRHHDSNDVRGELQITHTLTQELPRDPIESLRKIKRDHKTPE